MVFEELISREREKIVMLHILTKNQFKEKITNISLCVSPRNL